MRGYLDQPAILLLANVTNTDLQSAKWNIALLRRLLLRGVEWQASNWTLPPKKPHIDAKLHFMTDGRAISYAKSVMRIVEHSAMRLIVGEAPAGTNGNINQFRVSGGAGSVLTGVRAMNQDDFKHQGVGVQPTVHTQPTSEGIAKGKDQVLDKALHLPHQLVAKSAATNDIIASKVTKEINEETNK